jgi:hypothetical protein
VTTFLRLLAEEDKQAALMDAVQHGGPRVFVVGATSFRQIPGTTFAYWVSEAVRQLFSRLPALESDVSTARQGLATAEDFRFVRTWWENQDAGTPGFAKGGAFSPFYADVHLVVRWRDDGAEIKAGICRRYPYLDGNAEFVAKNPQYYLRSGLTWPRRTTSGLSLRVMPLGCVFADKGPAVFVEGNDSSDLLALLAVTVSRAFGALVELQLAAADAAARSYEVGVIQRTPVPNLSPGVRRRLASFSRRAWSLKRTLDTVVDTSHAFLLPAALRPRVGHYDPPAIEAELAAIQAEIDETAFDLYAFSTADRAAVKAPPGGGRPNAMDEHEDADEDNDDEDGADTAAPSEDALLPWAVGVAFGRFDWRLATGERDMPSEPEPFDPLPAKSPGMLPDGSEPFHTYSGILVDDPGHTHDLTRLVEAVLERVDTPVPADVRRWLQREFFALHLQQYSKSRRKAPIYWPLATPSGRYTLWIYYPTLSSQTLYTAVNDFLEPKLAQLRADIAPLASKGGERTRSEEKTLEELQALVAEVAELREALLQIAQNYRPNHDDGVQITAAPLWALFRHKPWQRALKDTWGKLEKGDYDWAHLAMTYWPNRVREKCKTDKSLAIAHGLADVFCEPPAKPTTKRSRRRAEDDE